MLILDLKEILKDQFIYLFIYLFSYLFRKHKYKFTNTSIQTQVIILNKNMFAGSL